eukprot:EC122554.1.p1 GENE.EC122554.1~~EC122554.1.p1  ORF type:complete len:130 (+),score=19.95 EC122554.1:73-462(+)
MGHPVKEVQRDLLAAHETKATFEGVRNFPCRFLTSLCPNQCNHGGEVAVFNIDEYISFDKRSEYGEKVDKYHIKMSEAEPQFADKIKELSAGDKVLLDWWHEYVTTTYEGGGVTKSPDRPCKKIEKITA